jgi:hypothetical protein
MGDYWCWWTPDNRQGPDWIRCPFGRPGDTLYLQETLVRTEEGAWVYDVDKATVLVPLAFSREMLTWTRKHKTPRCLAKLMPPFAARYFVQVTQVEVKTEDEKHWRWRVSFDLIAGS